MKKLISAMFTMAVMAIFVGSVSAKTVGQAYTDQLNLQAYGYDNVTLKNTGGALYINSVEVTTNALVGEDFTLTDDMVVGDDLAVTGLATVGETLVVTGAVTHSATTSMVGAVSQSTTTMTGGLIPYSKTQAQLEAFTSAQGVFRCSDCTVTPVCISTGGLHGVTGLENLATVCD